MSKKYLDEQGLTRLVSLIKEKLNTKVDKVEGKTLSTNDYTDEEKEKLANCQAGSFLDTQKNYETPYEPLYDGSPATKKYVDSKSIKIYDISELTINEYVTTNLEKYQEIYEQHKLGKDIYMIHKGFDRTIFLILHKDKLLSGNSISASTQKYVVLGSGLSSGVTTVGESSFSLQLNLENDIVNEVIFFNTVTTKSYIEANSNYTTPYVPKFDGSPATKKYVDDSIESAIGQALSRSY